MPRRRWRCVLAERGRKRIGARDTAGLLSGGDVRVYVEGCVAVFGAVSARKSRYEGIFAECRGRVRRAS
jgi:hypothetical protein